jgi:stage V sporulation protein G
MVMEITEVRVKLMGNSEDRLQAFCSITFDNCFVVRDLKVIEGTHGPFVAMPSRKLTFHCKKCGFKNHLRSSFCNKCGAQLKHEEVNRDPDGRSKLYADIAHPINTDCRELIQTRVIEAYQQELGESGFPGYISRYDEDYVEDSHEDLLDAETVTEEQPQPPEQVAETEHAFVQEAETEPRPPHTLTTTESATEESAATSEVSSENDFGAGIF